MAVVRSQKKLRSGPKAPAASKARRGPGRPRKEFNPAEITEGWKQRLYSIINQRGLSMREASIGAGLNPSTIRSMLVTPRQVGIEVLEAICDYLDISIEWLVRATGDSARDASRAETQQVPVLRWKDIGNHLEKGECEAMRTLVMQTMQPSEKRFALEFSGSSMSPYIQDRDDIDCLPGLRPHPDDIVIAWSRALGEYVCRRIKPTEVNPLGTVVSGQLEAIGSGWSNLEYSHKSGDRIVAVVVGVRRALRRQ